MDYLFIEYHLITLNNKQHQQKQIMIGSKRTMILPTEIDGIVMNLKETLAAATTTIKINEGQTI